MQYAPDRVQPHRQVNAWVNHFVAATVVVVVVVNDVYFNQSVEHRLSFLG